MFAPMHQTPTRRLAEILIDEPLESFVATRRDAGRSWRVIARDLWTATDGQIDVTAMTLQNWFAGDTKASA